MLSVEETNTNFIAFGFNRSGLEHTIYSTHGEHANHYTADAVHKIVASGMLGEIPIVCLIYGHYIKFE